MLTDIAPSVPGQFYSSHHSQMGITNIAPHIQKTVSKQQNLNMFFFSMKDPKNANDFYEIALYISSARQRKICLSSPNTSMLSLA